MSALWHALESADEQRLRLASNTLRSEPTQHRRLPIIYPVLVATSLHAACVHVPYQSPLSKPPITSHAEPPVWLLSAIRPPKSRPR